jgi:hypothetical protein
MESGEDEEPGPHSSFQLVSHRAIPAKSIVIQTVQAHSPYESRDRKGKVTQGKVGDMRVQVFREAPGESCRIPWLERGWKSKRLSLNFMKALHYGQRLEQAIRMRNCIISPEVRDPDLLRKVV